MHYNNWLKWSFPTFFYGNFDTPHEACRHDCACSTLSVTLKFLIGLDYIINQFYFLVRSRFEFRISLNPTPFRIVSTPYSFIYQSLGTVLSCYFQFRFHRQQVFYYSHPFIGSRSFHYNITTIGYNLVYRKVYSKSLYSCFQASFFIFVSFFYCFN